MINNLTIIIPFRDGHSTLSRLLASIPEHIPVIIVDDQSDLPLNSVYYLEEYDVETIRLGERGFFAGAVNAGIQACKTDVLVLNQDTWFDSADWVEMLEKHRSRYAMIGERIHGTHPSFGDLGYIHGVFMFLRRDAIEKVGLLAEKLYPLWGNTALYQWGVARAGFEVLPLKEIPGFYHTRKEGERYGSSIKNFLSSLSTQEKEKFIHTPPLLSIIVPCFNYGVYIQDCINSLIGGPTSLGMLESQSLASFEVIIVDDASTDNSWEMIQGVTDISKGIRSYRLQKNVGTAKALNFGIEKAAGKYITFLSADDMRESFSLEKLVEACEQNPHSFAYDDVWLFHSHQRIKKWIIEEYDFEKLIWKNQIHAGIVFPKKAWENVGGYPALMDDGREDWAFNVALGVHGWCGVHVHQFGYLYRREGQNRTETNTTERHRQQFLGKIMSVFPAIYEGERPMACCGKGGSAKVSNSGAISNSLMGGSAKMASQVGVQGMVKIEYTGQQMSSTWTGDTTAAPYIFGSDRKKGWVDKRDVGDRENKKGFLSKKDRNGNWIFKVATGEKAVEEQSEMVTVIENQAVGISEVMPFSVIEEEPAVGNMQGSVVGATYVGPIDHARPNSSLSPKVKAIDSSELNVEQIKALDLTPAEWQELYRNELGNRNRKGAISFIEERLAEFS